VLHGNDDGSDYGIPLNVVVINNGTLSLIRKNQFQLYGERYIDCDFSTRLRPARAVVRGQALPHRNRGRTRRPVRHADLTGTINLIEMLLDKHAFPRYLSASLIQTSRSRRRAPSSPDLKP